MKQYNGFRLQEIGFLYQLFLLFILEYYIFALLGRIIKYRYKIVKDSGFFLNLQNIIN